MNRCRGQAQAESSGRIKSGSSWSGEEGRTPVAIGLGPGMGKWLDSSYSYDDSTMDGGMVGGNRGSEISRVLLGMPCHGPWTRIIETTWGGGVGRFSCAVHYSAVRLARNWSRQGCVQGLLGPKWNETAGAKKVPLSFSLGLVSTQERGRCEGRKRRGANPAYQDA